MNFLFLEIPVLLPLCYYNQPKVGLGFFTNWRSPLHSRALHLQSPMPVSFRHRNPYTYLLPEAFVMCWFHSYHSSYVICPSLDLEFQSHLWCHIGWFFVKSCSVLVSLTQPSLDYYFNIGCFKSVCLMK